MRISQYSLIKNLNFKEAFWKISNLNSLHKQQIDFISYFLFLIKMEKQLTEILTLLTRLKINGYLKLLIGSTIKFCYHPHYVT